uniref:Uncharacterized protein n=1 Tax=Oryza glaberrima TaxID=4538 RepID=I1P312_ORYGL
MLVQQLTTCSGEFGGSRQFVTYAPMMASPANTSSRVAPSQPFSQQVWVQIRTRLSLSCSPSSSDFPSWWLTA